ncbi:hypothetical protein B0T22DRAFT_378878 [Podospora appendiculata]|uniref:Uncharacterized protein n=1 Tax=Podospora appendiculata TaxID=314037 RepID=A0AAE1CBT7_9PEZI|nr:hypothetical protein B0T22DRAFT_378878 [Podospora appendiculata]
MALWPFRRKSRRKRSRPATTDFEEPRGRAAEATPVPRSQTLPDLTSANVATPPQQGPKKQRGEPNKLQRKPRTYSFSPGRNDSINIARKMTAGANPPVSFRHTREDDRDRFDAQDEDLLRRVPTLHNKRDGDHLPRKKSSKKRRKDDREREAEIKAMSNFIPLRAATEDWAAGRPMKKDSKRVKTGLGLGFKGAARHEWDKENRSSDISLPVPESIHSSLSSDSEYISFKVSVFETLAPRPTLRYTVHPRWEPSHSDRDTPPVRQLSQKQRKLSMPIPEATIRAHKRIDDLADDLNASDLRELMERDKRRRERKQQRDQQRLELKLARRAEKQRAADAEAARGGKESPPNMERGVLGRESVGLGIDSTSAVVTSSRRRDVADSSEQWDKPRDAVDGEAMEESPRLNPLAAFHRTDSIPLESMQSRELQEEHVPPLTSPKSRSSFLRTKMSRSKSPQESEAKTEHSESLLQKGSETSSSKGPLSWTSFFRWNRHKRGSAGPSSFSNTSRDSMQITQLPAPQITFVPRRVSSGVPKRTMSRFREDLPELPMSPPDSRIHSPEADPIPPTIAEASPDSDGDGDIILPTPARYDTPTSEQRSIEAMRQTPSTFGPTDEAGVSPEPQTMSLASIDSEASWLSGGLSRKRKSSGILQPTPRAQQPQSTPEYDNEHGLNHNSREEVSIITDDDYLSRFAPGHADRLGWNRKSTGEARPSSDGEEEAHWGSVVQHPLVVHNHTTSRMKSREGLLNAFGEQGEVDFIEESSPTGYTDDGIEGQNEGPGVQRATSVNLGQGHARHISAGSARLLSISPRSSADVTRRNSRRSVSPRP